MHIGMILTAPFPPDIRVEKEARSLIKAGFQVSLLCSTRESPYIREEIVQGIHVKRINVTDTFDGIFWALIFTRLHLYEIFFANIYWRKEVLNYARERDVDALHLHDLTVAKDVLWVGRLLKIPVILDFHENFPIGIQSTAVELNKNWLWKHFFYKLKRWKRYESISAGRAHKVIAVIEEMKQRLLNDYGLPGDKIVVVPNTEDKDYFLQFDINPEIVRKNGSECLTIGYIGSYSWHRGLDVIIDAVYQLKSELNIQFLIVGRGAAHNKLQMQVESLKLTDRVKFIGWQPFEKVPSFIAACDVCVVPHHSTVQTEAGAPHKLFQYMLMKKPILVSNCAALKRIIEETQSGLVFQAGNSKDAARCLLQLQDEKLRKQLGENGYCSAMEKYNWEITSQGLIEIYNQLER